MIKVIIKIIQNFKKYFNLKNIINIYIVLLFENYLLIKTKKKIKKRKNYN